MNNKNNNTKLKVKALMAMLLVAAVGSVNASTLKLDATGIDVKSADGVTITSGNFGAKFGYFQSYFTATSLNLALWD